MNARKTVRVAAEIENPSVLGVIYGSSKEYTEVIEESEYSEGDHLSLDEDLGTLEREGIIQKNNRDEYQLTEEGEQIAETLFSREELTLKTGLRSRGFNIDTQREYRRGFHWHNGQLYSIHIEDPEEDHIEASHMPAEEYGHNTWNGPTQQLKTEMPENSEELAQIAEKVLN